jgi:hypothetical protein
MIGVAIANTVAKVRNAADAASDAARAARRLRRRAHDPNPRTLFTMWPVRKMYQHMPASVTVSHLRALS